jgi:hypothetical protein
MRADAEGCREHNLKHFQGLMSSWMSVIPQRSNSQAKRPPSRQINDAAFRDPVANDPPHSFGKGLFERFLSRIAARIIRNAMSRSQ